MTPNRPKSAKKSGSRKSSAGAMQTRLPQDPRSRFSLLWKHKIWTAAALAAVILVAIGLGYQLLNGSTRNMASASSATFVGSETCAGCHRARSAALARLAAPACHGTCDRQVGARRFLRCEFRLLRRAIRASSARTESFWSRPTGPTASSPFRSQVHVRRRSAAAISGRVSRRPPAGPVARLGQPAEGARAASAGSISIRTRRSSTTTSCTGPG